VGHKGSSNGTQLSNFILANENLPSVVLLDELDHCESKTLEGFYRVFGEGLFTYKNTSGSGNPTQNVNC
jgi:ATP-dependent Clp protease ATP-binding subunit ClpA